MGTCQPSATPNKYNIKALAPLGDDDERGIQVEEEWVCRCIVGKMVKKMLA
jgi:hypothetical protein